VVYSRTWVESDPPDTQLASLLGQVTRYLKTDIRERLFLSGPIASRPTPEAVFVGLTYIATDEAKVYRWNGTGWDEISLVAPTTPDGARVYNSAPINIPSGVDTKLTFDTERYDNGGLHDPGANPGRLTAQKAGTYVIVGMVDFAAISALGFRGSTILLNGGTSLARSTWTPRLTASNAGVVTTVYHLAANDYVELQVYQDSGITVSCIVTPNLSPEFAMQWLGL